MSIQNAFKAAEDLNRVRKSNQMPVYDPAEAQKQATINVEQQKQKTEFARYKQDCRKRALEMAHAENNTEVMRRATSLNQGQLGGGINIIATADKYYSWLISIPE